MEIWLEAKLQEVKMLKFEEDEDGEDSDSSEDED